MHIYHSETNQQHGIPLQILQRQPVPTQRAGLYEIPCSHDKIYIRLTSCHISTMTSQSSVLLHTLGRQTAARTSSEQKSQPTYRPTNQASSTKPLIYANTLKTSNREMNRDYIQPGPNSSPPPSTLTSLNQSFKQSINACHTYRLLSLGKTIFASFYDQQIPENP